MDRKNSIYILITRKSKHNAKIAHAYYCLYSSILINRRQISTNESRQLMATLSN